MSKKNIKNRLKSANERSVLLQILDELNESSDETQCQMSDLLEASTVFERFLTPREMMTKLEAIVRCHVEPMDVIVASSSMICDLVRKRRNLMVQLVLQWIDQTIQKELEEILRKSVEVPENDDIEMMRFKSLADSLLHLPGRIGNCAEIAENAKDRQKVVNILLSFENCVVKACKSALEWTHSNIGKMEFVNLQTIAFLVMKGRNLKIGTTTLLTEIVTWISDSKQLEGVKWDRIAQRLFTDESLGIREFESVVVNIVGILETSQKMERCFGFTINSSNALKRVLTVKILFQRVLKLKTLKIVLDYINQCSGEHLLEEVLKITIRMWANVAFVRTATIEQQRQTTRIILYIIFLSRNRHHWSWSDHFFNVSDGIQSRLSNSDRQVRITGMFVGECVARQTEEMKQQNEEEKKLKFDYDADDEWLDEMRQIVENGIFENSEQQKIIENSEPEPKEPPIDLIHDKFESEKCQLDSDDDEDFPIFEIPKNEKEFEKLAENEEPLRRVEPPKYVADAYEQLLEKEKYEIFEAALHSLKPMIRRNSIGFAQICCQLAVRLILLDNKFSTPKFEEIRKSCVVSCLVQRPQSVGNLIQHMLSNNWSMSHRYLLLDCIRAAAIELGKPVEIEEQKPTNQNNEKEEMEQKEETWREVVEKRIRSKTRRLTTAMDLKKNTHFVENRLGKNANLIFYPLLVQSTDEHLELRGRDCGLFAKLIFTMTDVFLNAGLSPKSPQMARSLIDYVQPHRYSDESLIRIACLFAFCSVVDLLPINVLSAIFDLKTVEEWASWAAEIAENVDCHEHERQLAKCLMSEIWSKIEKEHGN